jgi:capsid protein
MGRSSWFSSFWTSAKPKPVRQAAPRGSVRAKYDAAQTDANNRKHWAAADALSPRAAITSQVRLTLRNRSRYEIANNCYAKGIVSTLVGYTIGTGPEFGLDYIGDGLSREQISRTARTVSRLFWEWWDESGMPSKLSTCFHAVASDGEGFLRRYSVDTNRFRLWESPVTLNFQNIEADYCESPTLALGGDDSGVIADANGDVLGYYIYEQHPGDYFTPISTPKQVRRSDIYHVYKSERPGQLRGVPWLTPALPIFANMRRFVLATLAAAEAAANPSGVLYTDSPPDEDEDVYATPFEELEIARNALMTLPNSYKLTQFQAEHPNAQYEAFITACVREAARCVDMPVVLALDASKYNYASGRLDLQGFWQSRSSERYHLGERQLCNRAFRDWLDEAWLIPGYLPPLFRSTYKDWAPNWRWREPEHVDRSKEANGQATELANHTTTLAREYARRGQYWEDELRQRAAEIALMKELNLTPAQAAPAPPAADRRPDDDAPEIETDDMTEEAQT